MDTATKKIIKSNKDRIKVKPKTLLLNLLSKCLFACQSQQLMTGSQHSCCIFGGHVLARKSTKLNWKLTSLARQPCFGQKDTDWGSGPIECGISSCPKNEKPL